MIPRDEFRRMPFEVARRRLLELMGLPYHLRLVPSRPRIAWCGPGQCWMSGR